MGKLQINPKIKNRSFVKCSNLNVDIVIPTITDRNRAFDGDTVVVALHNPTLWTKNTSQFQMQKAEIIEAIKTIAPNSSNISTPVGNTHPSVDILNFEAEFLETKYDSGNENDEDE